jgi:serine/threonine protein kinase
MPLAPGIKLGPYDIIALLGPGGMGEVYRARDSALGREVAVKILHAGTLHEPDRLRRFRQEAQATASLNHPNILSIYFVGEHESMPFIVSELLKGETLRERMRREQLPVRKCLEIARQIIQGPAAAHEKGIVHRDLKPENIFLTEDGPAKILDFGLAKLVETDNRTADPNTDTVTQGSAAGVVLGTVGYMSPEQVRGGPVDSRADIFAIGAILYEMLSGKRAFHKDSSDGNQLAVTRRLKGKFRAEFPQGKPLHETADEWLGSIRLSPQGNAVALTEHPLWQGDAGKVVVYDREGKELARSPAFWSVEGLAWSPHGDEIWFLASKDQQWANELHALSLSGQDRIILRLPGILRLHDVSRDGRLLLSREIWRSQIFYRGPGDLVDRDLSWLDYSIVTDISTDGQELAFSEEGEATRNSFFSYTRKKDGSPAVKLGTWGRPVFSPDRKSVVAILGTGEQLVVLPTGVGEVHELNPSSMLRFSSPGWQPDGRGVFYAGNDGHGWRIYTQELSGADPRGITPVVSIHPERFESNILSYDGKYVVARNLDGAPMMYSVDGAEPHAIIGMDTEDVWINWSRDGRSGYIFRWGEVPARVFRLDLSSGKKQLITTLLPNDQVGVTTIMTVRITPDGKSYAYTSGRALSELFLVSGAK